MTEIAMCLLPLGVAAILWVVLGHRSTMARIQSERDNALRHEYRDARGAVVGASAAKVANTAPKIGTCGVRGCQIRCHHSHVMDLVKRIRENK